MMSARARGRGNGDLLLKQGTVSSKMQSSGDLYNTMLTVNNVQYT